MTGREDPRARADVLRARRGSRGAAGAGGRATGPERVAALRDAYARLLRAVDDLRAALVFDLEEGANVNGSTEPTTATDASRGGRRR